MGWPQPQQVRGCAGGCAEAQNFPVKSMSAVLPQ
jgi:hypothetical protein